MPPTSLAATPHGVELETFVTGCGVTTVFAPGLTQGIAETRPLGSAVAGRKVFLNFRGHGRSGAPPGPWTYLDLARDLRAVADLAGATRALGVSMGAGALIRLSADNPTRFERVVFFLPASLYAAGGFPADRLDALLAAAAEPDPGAIAEAVSAEIPPNVRATPSGWAYLRQRVEQIVHFGLSPTLATLADQSPLPDAAAVAALRAVTATCLVIGCHGDDMHPVEAAVELADVLPSCELYLYDRPAMMWNDRADVRDRVAGFLN